MSLEKKKANRFKVLNALYELTDGEDGIGFDRGELEEKSGLSTDNVEKALHYLNQEGLVERFTIETIRITHEGVREVEAALDHPAEETTYFPPVNIVNNYGNVTNSTIQQAGSHSTQTATVQVESEDVQKFLTLLRAHLDDLGIEATEKKDLVADIDTVEAQLKRSSPKTSVIGECLTSIRAVIEGALANGLAAKAPELMALLPRVLGM